jgi:PPOX class probable F420-dependent enzyme
MKEISDEVRSLLKGRRIATLATENPDGSVHLTAVWYLFEEGVFYVTTFSKSQKGRNLRARPRASLMVDVRTAGSERGVTAIGEAEILASSESKEIQHRIHARYLTESGLKDEKVGPVLAGMDDLTVRITPRRWIVWDVRAVDAAVFEGRIAGNSYLLPLDA